MLSNEKIKPNLLPRLLHLISQAQQFSLDDQAAADYFVLVFHGNIIEMICHLIAVIAQPVGADRMRDNLYGFRLDRRNGYLQRDLFIPRRQRGEHGQESAAADIDRFALNRPGFAVIVGELRLERPGDHLGNGIDPEEFPHLLVADGFADNHPQGLRIVDPFKHRFEGHGRSAQVYGDNARLLEIDVVDRDHPRFENEGDMRGSRLLEDPLRPDPVRTVLQGQENTYGPAVGDVLQGGGIKAHSCIVAEDSGIRTDTDSHSAMRTPYH